MNLLLTTSAGAKILISWDLGYIAYQFGGVTTITNANGKLLNHEFEETPEEIYRMLRPKDKLCKICCQQMIKYNDGWYCHGCRKGENE